MSTPHPLRFLALWGLIFLACIAFWVAVVIAVTAFPGLSLALLAAMLLLWAEPSEAESRVP